MKRKILAMLAALAAVLGIGLGVGASPASAADNVDRTTVCVTSGGGGSGIAVKIHSNWDNTAGGNGALLDYWSTKLPRDNSPSDISRQAFRVQYYTGGYSAWTDINMATNGPNYVGEIWPREYSDGYTWGWKWVHQHGYSNRYELQVRTWGYNGSSDYCTVSQSPYWA